MANIVNLPTTRSSEEWLPRLRRGLRKLTEGDTKWTYLPSELLLSQGQRSILQGKVDVIRESLSADTDDDHRKGMALARMWLVFPAQMLGEAESVERSKLYLLALSDFAAWPVEKACERWLKGDAQRVLGQVSYAFAPSPPQLVLLAKDCAEELAGEAIGYQELLDAKPDLAPETEEQLSQRAAFINALTEKHGPSMGLAELSDEEAEKRRAIRSAQMGRASDILREREFAAYGLPVPSEGSLEASPTLLRLLAEHKSEAA